MADSILVVTHGMGKHTAESTKKTVVDAANKALQRYPSMADKKFENYVDVKAIGYDDIFEAERARLVAANKPVSEYFRSVGGFPNLFIEKLVNLEEDLGEDNFYTTHVLDVVLYASLHSEPVRLRLVQKLTEIMQKKGGANVHVMAHSLGTAAMHDTLHKAYSDGITDEGGTKYSLSPVTHKLDSLWMVANVSRLMYALNPIRSTHDPMNTVVKPGLDDSGCTRYMYNIRHVLDPFTKFYRFDPQDHGQWIHPEDYSDYYRYIVTQKITDSLNPHDLAAYIQDPKVAYGFLKRTMPAGVFAPSSEDVSQAHASVRHVVGEAKKIKEYVEGISSLDDFTQLLKMAKEYQAYIEELKKEWES